MGWAAEMKPVMSAITNADGSVTVSLSGKASFHVDGAASIADTDIRVIVSLWALVVLVTAYLMGRWALGQLQAGNRVGLMVPPVVMVAVALLSPWLQFIAALWFRNVSLGATSYGFIAYEVPGWIAPLIGTVAYALTIVVGRMDTQPPPAS